MKQLSSELLLKLHYLMVKSRVLEERMINIYRQGQAYFWIGGPGEEAFGVPLGLLVKKGCGLDYDWLHLHYRATPTLVAMGLSMRDALRLIMNKVTDKHTGGRNFSNHYCVPKWNVAPITSVIGSQYSTALGTAHVQSRSPTSAITIVTGGDAGTAEGDFATSLIWASRPVRPLPMLITVQNNGWGISTSYQGQHGEKHIVDRGKAFNIETALIDGNNPVESYIKLEESMKYIREKRRPVLLEAFVSRLYGHSSASGANYVKEEPCCIALFEKKLKTTGCLTEKKRKNIWDDLREEAKQIQKEVAQEPDPQPESIWDHVYANNENANEKKF
ncbi:MAG: thiamine pyrophosphate-dependent dehydrogenase E1 component subunit alpha [Bdellovibrionales bacterium]|nr:thiamine pyrophosphate-dependent dehydrogenase E1 component subunit alpha [Bdellovibrionales bacterium]